MTNSKQSFFRRIRFIYLPVLVLLASFVYAQSPAVDNNGNPDGTPCVGSTCIDGTKEVTTSQANSIADSAIGAFVQVVASANKAIDSIRGNGKLQEYGQRLTLTLTSVVIIWSIIKNIALKQSLPQLVGDLIFPLIIAAFVLSAGLQKLPAAIEGAKAVTGVFGSGSSDSMEASIAGNMITAAKRVWAAESPSLMDGPLINGAISAVAMLLLRIGVILLIIVSAALGVGTILVAKFQIALGIALAPLLIPWIVFKPTEFLFNGWLNFLLKAVFGLVAIFAVSSVVSSGAALMASMIQTTPPGTEGVLVYLVMGGMSVIFTYLMLKAADIGEGIISGSATGIGGLAAVAKGSAAKSPATMAKAGLGAAGSATRVAAGAGVGKALSGQSLSGAQKQLANKAFGNGTVARAAFEKTSRGASTRSAPKSSGGGVAV
jgi:type IV secretion system protein TrbL